MRLQVFLSHNGVCSRRDAMDIVQAGRVKVNGKVVREPSTQVDGSETILVDNQKIGVKQYAYVILHKPVGYTTTKDDVHAEKTVMELLPNNMRHLSPVGRLDRDTEGLLLFTNDGKWAQQLTHPKFRLGKTYEVIITGLLKPEVKKQVEAGVEIDDTFNKKTAPCRITDVRYNTGETSLIITIYEGRKRQVRLMFYSVGHKVVYLKRIAIGRLGLGQLKLGLWRLLTEKEMKDVITP